MNHYVVDSWDDDASDILDVDRHSVMLTQMTSSDILDVEKIFKKYDLKNNGYIDSKHALAIFKAAGQHPSIQTENEIIEEANQSNTGMIMLAELVTIFKKHWKSKEYAIEEFVDAVRLFGSKSEPELKNEEDENDIIEMDKLNEALLNFGDKLEPKDVELLNKIIFKSDIVKEKNIKMPIKDFVEILANDEPKKKAKKGKPESKKSSLVTKKK